MHLLLLCSSGACLVRSWSRSMYCDPHDICSTGDGGKLTIVDCPFAIAIASNISSYSMQHTLGTLSWQQGNLYPSFMLLTASAVESLNTSSEKAVSTSLCFLPMQTHIYIWYWLVNSRKCLFFLLNTGPSSWVRTKTSWCTCSDSKLSGISLSLYWPSCCCLSGQRMVWEIFLTVVIWWSSLEQQEASLKLDPKKRMKMRTVSMRWFGMQRAQCILSKKRGMLQLQVQVTQGWQQGVYSCLFCMH